MDHTPQPTRMPSTRELARLADLAIQIGDRELAADLIARIYQAYDRHEATTTSRDRR
jgi:hypothetical protein